MLCWRDVTWLEEEGEGVGIQGKGRGRGGEGKGGEGRGREGRVGVEFMVRGPAGSKQQTLNPRLPGDPTRGT